MSLGTPIDYTRAYDGIDTRPVSFENVESADVSSEESSAETSATDDTSVEEPGVWEPKTASSDQRIDAYHRWRPKFHIMALRGWMNDPCAPGYDDANGMYHLNFQWNPKGSSWGNLSWGCAQSLDLLNWTVFPTPSLAPTATEDACGAFTGCRMPKLAADGCLAIQQRLTAFYTSAQKLPINYRLPYTRGAEQLAAATSTDSGRNWERTPCDNIILDRPPENYDVTSWRDPFIESWRMLDELVGDGGPWLYGILSGGLRHQTPTVFLYRIDPSQPMKWQFLSHLVDIGLNFRPSPWSGDFGINWEVSNFLTLADESGASHQVLLMSVEGTSEHYQGSELSKDHCQMWMCGTLQKTANGRPRMHYRYGGILDHGCFYAANGFRDPVTDQFVTLGWIFEEDLPQNLVERQNWSGCLSIPRIVAVNTWRRVVAALHSDLHDLSCFGLTSEADGTHTLRTVSAMPHPRLRALRKSHSRGGRANDVKWFPQGDCAQIELDLTFEISATTAARVGIDIIHSRDAEQYTRIYFSPQSETLVIDRSNSTTVEGVRTNKKTAPHTLFRFQDNNHAESDAQSLRLEELHLHVFFDVSVLEVFANNRTAVTTRVYPKSGSCYGVRPFIDDTARQGNQLSAGGHMAAQSTMRTCDAWELDSSITYAAG